MESMESSSVSTCASKWEWFMNKPEYAIGSRYSQALDFHFLQIRLGPKQWVHHFVKRLNKNDNTTDTCYYKRRERKFDGYAGILVDLVSQTFCPACLSLCHSVPGRCPFVPPKRGMERSRGKGRGRRRGRTTAEEVELETDGEVDHPMPLQPKSPLQVQPKRGCLYCI